MLRQIASFYIVVKNIRVPQYVVLPCTWPMDYIVIVLVIGTSPWLDNNSSCIFKRILQNQLMWSELFKISFLLFAISSQHLCLFRLQQVCCVFFVLRCVFELVISDETWHTDRCVSCYQNSDKSTVSSCLLLWDVWTSSLRNKNHGKSGCWVQCKREQIIYH